MAPNRPLGIVVCTALTLSVQVQGAQAGRFGYSGALQVSAGDYGTAERTNSVYLFNGLAFQAGRWRFSASVPLVAQSAPQTLTVGGNPLPTGELDPGHGEHHPKVDPDLPRVEATSSRQISEMGAADPLLRSECELRRLSSNGPSIRVNVQVKMALSGQHWTGLSTGEWDYGGGFALSQRAGGGFVFADLTYWQLGDALGFELQNPLAYALAYGRPLAGGKLAGMVTLTGFTRLAEEMDPPLQVAASMGYWIRSARSLTVTAAAGLTRSAPDFSFSLGWRLGA